MSLATNLDAYLIRRLYPASPEWDRVVAEALDDGKVRFSPGPFGHLQCHINDCEVWVDNWPYAYGNPFRPVVAEVLPFRRTALRLREAELAYRQGLGLKDLDAALTSARGQR